MPTVWIPSLMQKLSHGQSQVQVEGSTVREVIDALEAAYPGFRDRLCENGRIRPALAVAVDGEISNEGMRRKVSSGSEVHFLPAISGGAGLEGRGE
jgi:molybdopterin synthase sulfur carrier subunit